jgi:protocatechuate 3,4-dioxygenase beta subunit
VGALVAGLGLTERGKETRTSRSDARGEFELTDLRTDLGHVLLVRAEGFGSSYLSFPTVEQGASIIQLGDCRLDRAAFLEGRVRDESGKARAGVNVTLKPVLSDPRLKAMGDLHGIRLIETDASGRFVFRDLRPGDWVLAAQGRGLVPPENLQLRLSAGELRRGLEVRLGLGLAIDGLVRDTDGNPLQGAWVSVSGESPTRGLGSMATDENGRFSLSGLSAGNFTLEVRGPGSDSATLGRFEPARLRHVQAGCAALDLRLLERTSSIRGRVFDVEGVPLPGAFVWQLTGGPIPPREFVLTDAEGRFEVPVPPGSTLQLMARRGKPLVQSEGRVTQGEVLAGRVMLEDPEPMAVSDTVNAGNDGVELRIPREYGAPK